MTEDDGLLIEIAATEKRYLQQLARMEAATVRSAKKAETGWRKANPTMARGFRDADRAATGFANGGMRQVSMQLSQVAQQGAVTGDYVRALSVQLPDLALGLGTVGIAAGALAAVFAPMILDMIDTGDSAKELKERLEGLAKAMSALDEATTNAGATPRDLIEDFGEYADQMQQVLLIQREIANLEAVAALSATASSISEVFGELEGSYKTTRGYLQNTVTETRSVLSETARVIAKDFGISIQQATALAEALREVGRAEGPEAQVVALRRAREQIELAAGGLSEMDDETSAVYRALLDAEMAAARLAGVDIAANISAAADEAGRLAGNLIAAYNLRNARDFKQTKQYSGRGSGKFEMGLAGEYSPPDTSDLFEAAERRNRRAGGRGKSEAEREAEREVNRLLAERDRIISSLETATERYERELSDLNKLLEMGEISSEKYAEAVGQIEQRLIETKFSEVIKGIESVSDAFARAIVSGENMGDALGNVFRQIASDLVSSGIKMLLMETFGFGAKSSGGAGGVFGKIIGSLFGGGRATGGPVSAGTAYTVGEHGREMFVPASNGTILNSQQTQKVMKPATANGGGQSVIQIDLSQGLVARILQEARGQSIRLDQQNMAEYSLSAAPRIQARVAGDPRKRY